MGSQTNLNEVLKEQLRPPAPKPQERPPSVHETPEYQRYLGLASHTPGCNNFFLKLNKGLLRGHP